MQSDLVENITEEQQNYEQLQFMLLKETTDALIFLSWKTKIVLYASLSVSIYL